ncbi:Chlorophyll a-b binding protein CP24 10A [Spatholobus suberectus]|nr:Chlorophyll a-b binding protein CP24 10A [Spatholobus suberectus]
MADATSGSVLNGFGSHFLCGGKKSQALLAAGIGGKVGAAVSTKRVIVAIDVAPKKSWIHAIKGGGNFIDLEWLDGSLSGDYGFDALGLGKDPAFLKWYREAELIHGRWAMAAVVGIFVG